MLSFLGKIIKLTASSLLVLVMGQLVTWQGMPVSDHVKTWVEKLQGTEWAGRVKSTARSLSPQAVRRPRDSDHSKSEEIPANEKQRLRHIIENLDNLSDQVSRSSAQADK